MLPNLTHDFPNGESPLVFHRKNGEPGTFCIFGLILAYLQLFLPMFSKPVGVRATKSAAEEKEGGNFENNLTF